ncbi:MAG: glycosyltransferase [Bacteroidota bacterium]
MIWLAIVLGLWNLWQLAWLNHQIRSVSRESIRNIDRQGVSIIIAAHNEASNLAAQLPGWLDQQYPKWECILVLDRCMDASLEIAESFQQNEPRLRIISIVRVPEGWSPKKWAIEQGAKSAQFDHWVLTDADCSLGPMWLEKHAEIVGSSAELVLGVGAYQKQAGFLNLVVRMETWFTALQYIGAAAGGLPYMGVGRNLAYTRGFYTRSGGMEAIRQHLSGDDDLLVNANADPARTKVLLHPDSWTWSLAPQTWADWWHQKTRHVSAANQYSLYSRFWLGSLHMSQIGFWTAAILACFLTESPLWGPGIILAGRLL